MNPSPHQILNESSMHNVPPGSETHFKVVLVSEAFQGKPLLQRHRLVNGLLSKELAGPVHALSLHLKTPDEWAKTEGAVAPSPPCRGGDKRSATTKA
jgi:BolA family transcriptional regulator, general stress-responsive regulator